MIKFDVHPHSRNGLTTLAHEQLGNGQAVLQTAASSRVPNLGNTLLGGPGSDLEKLRAHYQQVKDGPLSDLTPLSGNLEHIQTLGLILRHILPHYLNGLVTRLECYLPEKVVADKNFAIADPLSSSDGGTKAFRGHYTAPFLVIDASGDMKFLQHGASTLLHEITHAIGKLRYGLAEQGHGLALRQNGLSIHSRKQSLIAQKFGRLFTYFDEALATMSQMDFLKVSMGFSSSSMVLPFKYPADKADIQLKGTNIWPVLIKTGVIKQERDGTHSGQLPFTQLHQGEVLSSLQVRDKAIAISQFASTNKESYPSESYSLRDRQFLLYRSGYAVLTHHMQVLAEELWPDLIKQEAIDAMHACLLGCHITGDLKPLTNQMKKAFGEQAGIYIRALAALSNYTESHQNSELLAFVAFVNAARLPKTECSAVRTTIANAILKSANPPD